MGTDRLLDGCGVVEAVALEDVDVVELQALETLFDRVEDVLCHARTRGEYMHAVYQEERGGGRRGPTHLAVETLLVDARDLGSAPHPWIVIRGYQCRSPQWRQVLPLH